MDERQEPKYRIRSDGWSQGNLMPAALVNRASGKPIPADEPVFILRARDVHAHELLILYQQLCANAEHRKFVGKRIMDFARFASENPDRMKEPDSP
jgi:hypothetical protein